MEQQTYDKLLTSIIVAFGAFGIGYSLASNNDSLLVIFYCLASIISIIFILLYLNEITYFISLLEEDGKKKGSQMICNISQKIALFAVIVQLSIVLAITIQARI